MEEKKKPNVKMLAVRPETHKKVRKYAFMNDMEIRDFVEKLINDYIEKGEWK